VTNPLKFLLGGLLGFALAVPAGIMQADVGLNRILHNTQWVVGPHVHVAILVGLTVTLYSAIYLLFPILTYGAKVHSQKLVNVHFWCHLIGGVGMGSFMGMTGLKGMQDNWDYIFRRKALCCFVAPFFIESRNDDLNLSLISVLLTGGSFRKPPTTPFIIF